MYFLQHRLVRRHCMTYRACGRPTVAGILGDLVWNDLYLDSLWVFVFSSFIYFKNLLC